MQGSDSCDRRNSARKKPKANFKSQFLHCRIVRIMLLWQFNNQVCYFSLIEIICQDPGGVTNGNKQIFRRNLDEDYVAVGDRAEYNCFPGYKMEGSRYLTCTNSGEWNRAKPKCVCEYFKKLSSYCDCACSALNT